jgi:thymidine kinase
MDKKYTGSIELITGPMFSSKSSTLISKIDRYLLAKKKVVAIKWKGDTRYGNEPYIITHSLMKCQSILADDKDLDILCNGKGYEGILSEYDIICIDEGSFFKDIVNVSETLANKGHKVIVASLVGTYERKGFNDILRLIPLAEDVTMLKAVCMKCFKDGASFTKFTRDDIKHDGKEYVGGKESYIAVCRKCFFDD